MLLLLVFLARLALPLLRHLPSCAPVPARRVLCVRAAVTATQRGEVGSELAEVRKQTVEQVAVRCARSLQPTQVSPTARAR